MDEGVTVRTSLRAWAGMLADGQRASSGQAVCIDTASHQSIVPYLPPTLHQCTYYIHEAQESAAVHSPIFPGNGGRSLRVF